MVSARRVVPAVLALVLIGCGVRPELLARVGRAEIAVDDFQHFLESAAGEPWQSVDHRVATRLLDQYLDQEIVLEAGLDPDRDARASDPAVRAASVRPLLKQLCGEAVEPAPAAVAEEVERRLGEHRGRRCRVRQLLLPDLAGAESARARLIAGEAFEEVSQAVSQAPNATSGGSLGLLEEGTLPPEIDDVVFHLAVGDVSLPVRSPAGYHIFQVLEVVPAGPPPRFELEAGVRRELTDRSVGRHTRACLDRLAEEVGVRVYADHLWFDYDGRHGGSDDAQ